MIISKKVLIEEQLLDKKIIKKILNETVNLSVPLKFKTFFESVENKKELVNRVGTHAFLDSENLMYPVVNPNNGHYDCNLIFASKLRILQLNENTDLLNKVNALMESCGCNKRLNVQTSLSDETLDLVELINNFELDVKDDTVV